MAEINQSFFVAIPYFKDAHYLEETLDSLRAQTDRNWTAVVLDDSIDLQASAGAYRCVHNLNDPRITYVKNEQNIGMARNWNQALDLGSRFELCMILHADDRLAPLYITEMKKMSRRHPEASAFFTRSEIIGEDGKKGLSIADFYKTQLLPKQKEIILSDFDGIRTLIPGNFIFCPSLCYRPSRIGAERFLLPLKMVLDFEFILRILKKGEKLVGFYEYPLFYYRRHSGNTTQSLTLNLVRFDEEIELYHELAKSMDRLAPDIAEAARKMRVIKLNLSFQFLKSCLSFRFPAAYRFLKRLFLLCIHGR